MQYTAVYRSTDAMRCVVDVPITSQRLRVEKDGLEYGKEEDL